MKINQHVVKRENGWAVVGEGNNRDTSVHPTQHEAIERAREIAINCRSKVLIHGEDGKTRQKTLAETPHVLSGDNLKLNESLQIKQPYYV